MKFNMYVVYFAVCLSLGLALPAQATTNYVVVKNDNLSLIALRMCGNANMYRKLAKDNGIDRPNLIQIGQNIQVTCSETRQTATGSNRVGAHNAVVDTLRSVRSTPSYGWRTSASRDEIIQHVIDVFGIDEAQTALAIFMGESDLKLQAKGYNCRYRTWTGQKRSQACRPGDERMAWSIDCGLSQINVEGVMVNGLRTCPPELYTLEGNIAAAKHKYNERRWQPWVVYKQGKHKIHLAKFANLSQHNRVVIDTLVATIQPPVVDTLRTARRITSHTEETVQVTATGVISLR